MKMEMRICPTMVRILLLAGMLLLLPAILAAAEGISFAFQVDASQMAEGSSVEQDVILQLLLERAGWRVGSVFDMAAGSCTALRCRYDTERFRFGVGEVRFTGLPRYLLDPYAITGIHRYSADISFSTGMLFLRQENSDRFSPELYINGEAGANEWIIFASPYGLQHDQLLSCGAVLGFRDVDTFCSLGWLYDVAVTGGTGAAGEQYVPSLYLGTEALRSGSEAGLRAGLDFGIRGDVCSAQLLTVVSGDRFMPPGALLHADIRVKMEYLVLLFGKEIFTPEFPVSSRIEPDSVSSRQFLTARYRSAEETLQLQAAVEEVLYLDAIPQPDEVIGVRSLESKIALQAGIGKVTLENRLDYRYADDNRSLRIDQDTEVTLGVSLYGMELVYIGRLTCQNRIRGALCRDISLSFGDDLLHVTCSVKASGTNPVTRLTGELDCTLNLQRVKICLGLDSGGNCRLAISLTDSADF